MDSQLRRKGMRMGATILEDQYCSSQQGRMVRRAKEKLSAANEEIKSVYDLHLYPY
jgi:hypothetical protein